MLFLHQLSITQFKNYEFKEVGFSEKVTGICGKNGLGKTNLLDAIYYTCFTKSYFSPSDFMNVSFGKEGFRLDALYSLSEKKRKLSIVYKNGQKKECSIDGIPYEKVTQHLGLFPAVMIAPDDIEIINGGSEIRRKYIDALLCQLDAKYLAQLIRYNKLLQQRNSLLKNFATLQKSDTSLLEVIDQQLVPAADFIFNQRAELMHHLVPMIQELYQDIAQSNEQIDIEYFSPLMDAPFTDLLVQQREKDIWSQRTTLGIHRDDLKFEINGMAFKNTASQGQKKSLLFALKVAEYEWIKKLKGYPPLLLLDDVFEKLDQFRMNNLLHRVCKLNDGQVIITDTHEDRLESTFKKLGISFQLILLK